MAREAAAQGAALITGQHRVSPAASSAWARADLAWLAGLCLATYACYIPALHFDFVFDDRPFILQNPLLLSWRSIPRFFTAHLVWFLHPHARGTYYRPGLLLWLWAQRHLWRLNAVGWHLSTLTLHVLASLSVYVLAREFLRTRYGAGIAALVFALHPVHVESAAWIMGLPDPLMTLLAVSAMICHIHSRQSQGRSRKVWSGAALLLYTGAILTKEVALTLPMLVSVFEWIFPQTPTTTVQKPPFVVRFREALMPTWGFWAVTAVYLLARRAALGGLSYSLTPLAWRTLVATWPVVLWSHLKLLLWPVGLSAFYDVPYVTHPGLLNFALPFVAAAAAGLLMLWLGWKSPRSAFAGAWLFLPMALLLNLRVFPSGEIVHDRFMYFPSVGFSLLLGLGLDGWVCLPSSLFSVRTRQVALAVALGLAMGSATVYYERFWASDWTLYGRALAVAPGNNLATNNLAVDLADSGHYDEAIALERRILARDADYALARYNLGYCQYRAGKIEAARENLARAIKLSPAEPEPYLYLGLTEYRLGVLEESVVSVHRAVEISPENARYWFTLGMVLRAQGNLASARSAFSTAFALDPTLSAARDQLNELASQPAHH